MNETQQQLHSKALELSNDYRQREIELIALLQDIEKEKVYLTLGYSSLFTYCTEALKLSEERAYTFINVQRKCKEIPELKEKIESGKIPLTKARRLTAVLTQENKESWLRKAEELPKALLEKEIAALQPEEVRESVRPISQDRFELKIGVSDKLLGKLRRIQSLLSNKIKKPISLEEAIEFNADEILKRKDPLMKKSSLPQTQLGPGQVQGGVVYVGRMPIPASIKRAVLQRDHGECQYTVNQNKCGSNYFVHLHHRRPVSEGGLNTIENLVVLCSKHHSYWHEKSLK